MPKKKVEDEEDYDLYDTNYEKQIQNHLTGQRQRMYTEDTGFNNFDNEGDLNSWKMDALW